MNIVAIYNLGKDEDRLAKALATALGKTVYEARARLHVPGGGPSVVGVFQEEIKSEDYVLKLMENGFDALILTHHEIESDRNHFPVRSFELSDSFLRVDSPQEQEVILPYHDIGLMLYGTSIIVHNEEHTVNERKLSIGRAIMTSGLVMTKNTRHTVQTTEENRERFLNIYSRDRKTFVFHENALQYDALGKALQPSRSANFSHVVKELKRRCPEAVFDDRLLSRGNQAQILGPMFDPGEHLDIATSLLAKLLRPF